MRTLLPFLTLLLAFLSVHSQNWRLFDPARTYYYGNGTDSVQHVLRIDSFSVAGNDTIWYPAKRHRPDSIGGDYCWHFQEISSNFGQHIRQEPNGKFHFVYYNGDTLHLDLNATSPWRALTGHSSAFTGWINATPLGKSVTATPLGGTDSVHTIQLNAYSQSGSLVHSGNFLVGKQYGMFGIPFVVPMIPGLPGLLALYRWTNTTQLVGITNPDEGIYNIPRDRFFSMQAGDTIQIYSYDYDNGGELYLWTWRQDIYLSRTVSTNGDTIRFVIDRAQFAQTHNQPTPAPYHITVNQTVVIGNAMHRRLDRDLGETWATEEAASSWSWDWRINPDFPDRIMKQMNTFEPYDSIHSCLYDPEGQGPISGIAGHYYMDGLGGPYYKFDFPMFYEAFRRPVYFRIGGVARGSYVNFTHITGATDPIPTPSIPIYPNPCAGVLKVDLRNTGVGEESVMEVVSLQGQVLQTVALASGEVATHNVSDLPSGIYFVRITSPAGVATQKLIKL